MAFGYATFVNQYNAADPYGEFIFESYHWQWPVSSGNQYREYSSDPVDGIPPPEYATRHNQLISLKYLEGYDYPEDEIIDYETRNEDEEGFIYWPGGTNDAVNTAADSLDASDRAAFLMGEISEMYMRLVGLGDWVDRSKAHTPQQNYGTVRVGANLYAESISTNRIQVTDDLLAQRHQVTEEQLYSNYLARRRERRSREQREF